MYRSNASHRLNRRRVLLQSITAECVREEEVVRQYLFSQRSFFIFSTPLICLSPDSFVQLARATLLYLGQRHRELIFFTDRFDTGSLDSRTAATSLVGQSMLAG
jgi:hypothetical protein